MESMAANDEIRPRAKRMTWEQMGALVDAVSRNIFLHTEKYTTPQGKETHRLKWLELTDDLNNLGPAKDWIGWRQAWHDLKNRTRKRAREVRLASLKNTKDQTPLTPLESKVLEIIGTGTSYGVGDDVEDGMERPNEPIIMVVPSEPPSISTTWTSPSPHPQIRSPEYFSPQIAPVSPPSPSTQPTSFVETSLLSEEVPTTPSPTTPEMDAHFTDGDSEDLQEVARSIREGCSAIAASLREMGSEIAAGSQAMATSMSQMASSLALLADAIKANSGSANTTTSSTHLMQPPTNFAKLINRIN